MRMRYSNARTLDVLVPAVAPMRGFVSNLKLRCSIVYVCSCDNKAGVLFEFAHLGGGAIVTYYYGAMRIPLFNVPHVPLAAARTRRRKSGHARDHCLARDQLEFLCLALLIIVY